MPKKDGIVLRLDRLGRETRLLGCDNLGLWKSILVKAGLRAAGREKGGGKNGYLAFFLGFAPVISSSTARTSLAWPASSG